MLHELSRTKNHFCASVGRKNELAAIGGRGGEGNWKRGERGEEVVERGGEVVERGGGEEGREGVVALKVRCGIVGRYFAKCTECHHFMKNCVSRENTNAYRKIVE
jgi:hypothetical protein